MRTVGASKRAKGTDTSPMAASSSSGNSTPSPRRVWTSAFRASTVMSVRAGEDVSRCGSTAVCGGRTCFSGQERRESGQCEVCRGLARLHRQRGHWGATVSQGLGTSCGVSRTESVTILVECTELFSPKDA